MKSRYTIKVFNATLVLALYLLIGMYSCVHAQGIQRIYQKGYEVSYGFHNFKPRRVDEHTAKLSPGTRGISLGGYLGNNLLKIRVRGIGFYQANKLFDEDYYQYEAEVLSNFHPLEFFRVNKNIVDIYLITGLNYSHINFDNHHSAYEKKRFNRLSRLAGLGIEYIVRRGSKSICIFSDVTVANQFTGPGTNDENTPFPSIQSALNFGLRLGFSRHVKLKRGF